MLSLYICGYRLMAKLTAFQAVAMGSNPITRTLLDLRFSDKGGVTQLVGVLACHARSRGFESHHSRACKKFRSSSSVRTPPFHGDNTGSNPVRNILFNINKKNGPVV